MRARLIGKPAIDEHGLVRRFHAGRRALYARLPRNQVRFAIGLGHNAVVFFPAYFFDGMRPGQSKLAYRNEARGNLWRGCQNQAHPKSNCRCCHPYYPALDAVTGARRICHLCQTSSTRLKPMPSSSVTGAAVTKRPAAAIAKIRPGQATGPNR